MSRNIIKCPYCGAEYLPQELFIPSDFLPKFDDLVKDDEGKIVAEFEQPMNLKEEYVCDCCNHRFAVEAKVEFTSSKVEKHDFDFAYQSPIYNEDRVELSEND